jgi:1-acyl-sn-glycerol-3-phosphate acyltransferase
VVHPSDSLESRDPRFVSATMPMARAFVRAYVRLQVDGIGNIPRSPTIFAGNHNSGITGADVLCTLSTLWDALGADAPLYALAHDFVMRQVPLAAPLLRRFGAVRASSANAERILERGGSFLVYPGGVLDAFRHAHRRDEVVLGRRSGFIRVAARTGAPIVPIVAQGAHRSAYVFHEGEGIARRLGLPKRARVELFPLAFALPWGIAAGPWLPYLPLPFSIRLRILPPEHIRATEDVDAARERIRVRMQEALVALARVEARE